MMEVHPRAGTLADIYREEGSNPATAFGYSLGTTSDPEHFQLPLFSLHVTTRQPDIRTLYLKVTTGTTRIPGQRTEDLIVY